MINLVADARFQSLEKWLSEVLSDSVQSVSLLSGDASFRRYFRVITESAQYVVMDAPPAKESCASFIAVANAFRQHAIVVPTIYATDLAKGFLLLSDFGDNLYLQQLTDDTASYLYQLAFESLFRIQCCRNFQDYALPLFSESLYREEIGLFDEWYLNKYLGIRLNAHDRQQLERVTYLLIESALIQPIVCAHRDYHSRNLMLLEQGRVGILDFQDAVRGPVTYDLVSLLKDCYIAWPEQCVLKWAQQFHEQALQKNILQQDNLPAFLKSFDWMGLQRHLKCLGIFSRLKHRDGKCGYTKDIPRVLHYAITVCEKYPELAEFGVILKSTAKTS